MSMIVSTHTNRCPRILCPEARQELKTAGHQIQPSTVLRRKTTKRFILAYLYSIRFPTAMLDDKFGVTWQIVPKQLVQLMSDPDPARAGRVMQAILKMQKIDIATLQRAADDN